jgi:phage/conjugal plasmid C-4 type zinc finger TraR family protein
VTDAADKAQPHVEILTASAIAEVRRRIAQQPTASGATDCDDCGEPIPAARRQAMPGTRHCTRCRELLEAAA